MTPDMTARMVDGWAMVLVHSLWIGSAAALIVAALLQRLPAHRADLRAGVAFAGLLLSLIGSIAAPFISQPLWRAASEPVVAMTEDASYHDSVKTSAAVTRSVDKTTRRSVSPSPPSPQTSWRRAIVGAWLIGVAISLVRLGRSHIAARRLVRSAAALENRSLEAILDEVARALGVVTRATIKVTDRVATPLVYGFWSPVILLPVSLVTGAAPETLRVVLAHELWHLRRGDLWQTVAQRLVEAVLFYHPAVWWLSRQTEREREAACDAAAARVVGHGAPVATALLDVASLGVTTPAAAMGFSGGSLAERVQRLLRPSEQPRVRVAWGGLLAMLLLGLAALLSLTAGTGLVAREVVVAMTPAERVAAIEQAIAENDLNASQKIDPRTGRISEETPRCHVKGRFVTPDGEVLPQYAHGNMTWPGVSKTISIDDNGTFKETTIAQGAYFSLQPAIQGYATDSYGPFQATGESIDLGNLKLTRGFTAELFITGQDGEPLEGVEIVSAFVTTTFPNEKSTSYGYGISYFQKRPSDSNGVIELDRLTPTPIQLTFQKSGFERLREILSFTPGRSVELTLRRSKPTTGRFVDTAGNPVAGVELYCVRSDGDSLGGNDPRRRFLDKLDGGKWSETPLATSNDAGEFTLSSLIGSATYSLIALHRDHQPVRFDELHAGQELGDIVAKPPLVVSGRVLNASSNAEDGQQAKLYYSNPIIYPGMSYSDSTWAPLDEEGRFSLRQILPGPITFEVAGQSIRRDITHSIDNIEIDGDKIRNWQAENFRTVRVRIKAPDNQPLRGTVLVTWTLDEAPDHGSQRGDEYLDIPTEGDPVVETQAPIGAILWFNDHRMVGAYTKQSRLGVLPPGEGVYETTVTVESAGLAVGQVVDARGKPLSGCTVRLRVVEGSSGSSVRDADKLTSEGRFSLGPLPLDGDSRFVCEAQVNNTWRFLTSEPFTVTAAKPIHEVKLTAPDPVYLTGQVLDHNGEPAAKWPTALSRSVTDMTFTSGLGPLDDEGRFRIAVTPGATGEKHTLRVRPANGSTGLSLHYTPRLWGGGKDFGVVRLRPGSIVGGIVTMVDGRPAPPCSVMLLPVDPHAAANGEHMSTSTDEGRFRFEGVERVPQNLRIFPYRKIVGVEPASALVRETHDSYLRVTPTDQPVELRIVVSDEH